MRKQTEDYLQNQAWIWFLKSYNDKGMFVSIPNDERDPVASKRKRLTGRMKGAADVVLILDNGRVVWVEFKLPTGRQSDAQLLFERRVQSLGHQYHVVRSLEQFQNLIKSIL